MSAARSWLAEKAAMAYLARAEHCRRQLEIKLLKKGFSREEITPSLDYLEGKGYLNDERFCEAWLRNRLLHTAEGAVKLLAGLQNRGIYGRTAEEAVKKALAETDEETLCARAAEKLQRRGKTGKKLEISLYRLGFSRKVIEKYLKSGENS